MFNTDFSVHQLTFAVFVQSLPWVFLFISIICAFITPKLAWIGLAITLLSALFVNALSIIGISVVAVLFTLSFVANKITHRLGKTIIISLVIMMCIALATHLLPGFNNLLVLENVEKSVNSRAFTLYFNLDKPMILFALLLMLPTVLQTVDKPSYCKSVSNLYLLVLITIGFSIIFVLASAMGLIQLEFYLPSWWWLFALSNLLLTCVVEEVFFRGLIQQKLTEYFNPLIALVIASVLFGIAHFGGGLAYVLVATLAGILYGFIYQVTGKITYAILAHFTLNFIHLTLFTYPLLK